MTSTERQGAPPEIRHVSIRLAAAIVLCPIIFAWFLLRSGYQTLPRVLAFLWLGVVVALVANDKNGTGNSPSASSPASVSNGTPTAPSANTNAQTDPLGTAISKWQYSEDTDAMRGTKTKYATLESETELDLGFPYGAGKPKLTVRQRPSDGLNIILEAKGQFLCNQFNNEHVTAKFDDHPLENYECGEPSDASTGYLFIEGGRRFLGRLKSAKTLIIEAPFFQHGRQQMTFDVRGLNWK